MILDEPPEFHGVFASKKEAREEVARLRTVEDLYYNWLRVSMGSVETAMMVQE
jgi:hypothetical protein